VNRVLVLGVDLLRALGVINGRNESGFGFLGVAVLDFL
jgi:hypothetical protein